MRILKFGGKLIMIDHERKIIQIHVPKSGGLTIRYSLFNNKQSDRYMHVYPKNPHYSKVINDPNYYKFTFVRNPWDKLVSGYLFTLKKIKDPAFYKTIKKFKDFNEFVLNVNKEQLLCSQRFAPQINWIKDINYNFIGRFENLQEDFYKICDDLQIERIELPYINNSVGRKNYKEYYTEEIKNIVADLYKEDIKYFNYKF